MNEIADRMQYEGDHSSLSEPEDTVLPLVGQSPANDGSSYADIGFSRFGWMIVAALVAVAFVSVRYLALYVPPHVHMYLVQPFLWLLPASVATWNLRAHLPKVRQTPSDLVILAVTISFIYIALLVLSGFLFGFGNSPYPHDPSSILRNFWYVGSILVAREIARWYVLRALQPRGELISVGATWLLFWLTSLPLGGYSQLFSSATAFEYIGRFMLPAAAIHLLATYLSLRGGPVISIAYLGVMLSFEWFSPILSDLTWPIAALIGVIVPLLGLSVLESEGHLDSDTEASRESRAGVDWSWIAAAFILVTILWFNTGVFGVRPAIVHGSSMLPDMVTGDIAITRTVPPDQLRVGDVIRFKQGSRVVLHRIVDISMERGEMVFLTIGDNNPAPDNPVRSSAVEGELVMHVPKAGLPAIYFKQALNWVIN